MNWGIGVTQRVCRGRLPSAASAAAEVVMAGTIVTTASASASSVSSTSAIVLSAITKGVMEVKGATVASAILSIGHLCDAAVGASGTQGRLGSEA